MSIQDDIQKSIASNELYAIGESVPADWQQAFDTYLPLAKKGDSKAQFNLGYLYARGDIMEKDSGHGFRVVSKSG